MSANNQSENTNQTTNPQTPGGAAFVGSTTEYFRHMRKADKHAELSHHWIGNYSGILFCSVALYALAFFVGGWWFPQTYQAWLDFCMPLAEYVGGLTPRVNRITGELISGGYPERADDALHGIAMARILVIPAVCCMIVGLVVAARVSPAVVSCTRRTHMRIWLMILATFAMLCIFVYYWEFLKGESYGSRLHKGYHSGNLVMIWDVLFSYCIPLLIAFGLWRILLVRVTRFKIIAQPPKDKQQSP